MNKWRKGGILTNPGIWQKTLSLSQTEDKENEILDESEGEEVESEPQKHYHNIDKQF